MGLPLELAHPVSITPPTPAEDLRGHHIYFNLTNGNGTWQKVTDLSGIGTNGWASNVVTVADWQPNAILYLLFADDNALSGTDASIAIDDFGIQPLIPVITLHPTSQFVAPSAKVSFEVHALGFSMTYSWLKNGIPIQGATNSVYEIPAIVAEDAASYSVIISNAWGVAEAEPAVLAVGCFEPPALFRQPVSASGASGDPIALTIDATGTRPLCYQWLRNEVAIAGATNPVYLLSHPVPDDSGFYSVAVSNCAGAVRSTNAIVAISSAPYSIVPLTNMTWRYDDTGTNWGTTWRQPGFDDSSWRAGRGVLARENNAIVSPLTNTVLSLSNTLSQRFVTNFYFRTAFVLTNEKRTISLLVSNLIDDGCVIYLNGQESYRINMPDGLITANTFATSANSDGTFIITSLSEDFIKNGTNYIAAEVHQNGTGSSDATFGLDVTVIPLLPTILSITHQPEDLAVEELSTIIVTAGISGQAASFHWYKNGILLLDQTESSLHITNALFGDSGDYLVVANNAIHSITSRVAHVTIEIDSTPPRLQTADALDPTHVQLSFSEWITPDTATNIENYMVVDPSGRNYAISNIVQADGRTVMITTAPRPFASNCLVRVTGVTDTSSRHNQIEPASAAPIAWWFTFVQYDDSWFFYDPYPPFDDADPGSGWPALDFAVPGTWGNARGGLAGPMDPLPVNMASTLLSVSPALTAYFRHDVTLNRSRCGLSLFADLYISDGAVIYLNGAEVARLNLPPGVIGFDTSSLSNVEANALYFAGVQLPTDALMARTNVVAAELHQASPDDSKKAFAFQLRARSESAIGGPIVITSGPESVALVEREVASFGISAVGAEWYQWQVNGTNVPGADHEFLKFPARLELDGATISVLLSNSASVAQSTNARLHVIPDMVPPRLLSAYWRTNETIVLTFSEPVTAATASNPRDYIVATTNGQRISVESAALLDGTNVVLTFTSLPLSRYRVVAAGIRDTSVAGNLIGFENAAIAGIDIVAVPMPAAWRYDNQATDRGTVWRFPDYNDGDWPIGLATLGGRRDSPLPVPEPLRTPLPVSSADGSTIIPSYYFRTWFNSIGSASATLNLRTIVDDGCIIYLNGSEIFRLGMPNGPLAYNSLANRTVGDPVIEGPFSITVTNLVEGTNLLAVEVHQNSYSNFDTAWAVELSVFVPSIPQSSLEPAVPPLHWLHTPGTLTLLWNDSEAVIQSAPTITGPWLDVPNTTNTLIIPPTNIAGFYRLRR